MMKGFAMTEPVAYRPLPIDTDDFLRLKAAVKAGTAATARCNSSSTTATLVRTTSRS
jgi:hypothetical protein